MNRLCFKILFFLFLNFHFGSLLFAQTWTADNGNGTYTNPLFYDEFTDPDLIRVDDTFYLVGSSFANMPGLPLLKSKDLVNWEFETYVFQKLDLGPDFHLEGKKGIYGNGIWAPAIRYHNGTFYVFVNINDHGLQVFSATNPKGPWKHYKMGGKIYDLGVLFDGDKIYAVHGYDEVHLIEIKPDFSGYVEGSDRIIIPKGNAMGEGHHFYKIKGTYYIISADYEPVGRMQCARSDSPFGPYETVVISNRETMGTQRGLWTKDVGFWSDIPEEGAKKYEFEAPSENGFYAVPLHQGGIVDLPNGEWWGFSMMDVKSVGRLTFLSPVTWKDGFPYFGLENNLGRSPKTYFKPNVGVATKAISTYERSDDFSSKKLKPIWQWNHIPVDKKWALKDGVLRLNTLPAKTFMHAKNTLTQRSIGPESEATVELNVNGFKNGDIAGLALLNVPYYWLGIVNSNEKNILRFYDLVTNKIIDIPFNGKKIWLRTYGDYDKDLASFSYSLDGKTFTEVAKNLKLGYQMHTFQGVRYALFAYNELGKEGGFATFDNFKVREPLADRSQNIPINKIITIRNLSNGKPVWSNPKGLFNGSFAESDPKTITKYQFKVHDRGNGKVSLEAMDGSGFVTITGIGLSGDVRFIKNESEASLFLWQDLLRNEFMLLSLKTNRYVGQNPITNEPMAADFPGAQPDRKDGSVFIWEESK